VAGSPYNITASNATGGTFDLGNYNIGYINGQLTVSKAALTVTADNAVKTYGDAKTFTGTEFTSSGLKNSETIGTVTLASTGAAATANVAGSPYNITGSNSTGGTFDLGNYNIGYVNGQLTVSTNQTETETTAFNTAVMLAGSGSTVIAAAGYPAGLLDLNALPATAGGLESLEAPDMVISPQLRAIRCGINLPFDETGTCAP
jgi:hypothetical protein